MTDLHLSGEFLAALAASGRSKFALAREVASAIGCGTSTVANMLVPGRRVPHNNGRNTIVDAVCDALGLPRDQALMPRPRRPTPLRETAASIDKRFDQALAAIRRRRRLSDEDCHARRGSTLASIARGAA